MFLCVLFDDVYALDLSGISFSEKVRHEESDREPPKKTKTYKKKLSEVTYERRNPKKQIEAEPSRKIRKTQPKEEKKNNDEYMPNLKKAYKEFKNSNIHICQ